MKFYDIFLLNFKYSSKSDCVLSTLSLELPIKFSYFTADSQVAFVLGSSSILIRENRYLPTKHLIISTFEFCGLNFIIELDIRKYSDQKYDDLKAFLVEFFGRSE